MQAQWVCGRDLRQVTNEGSSRGGTMGRCCPIGEGGLMWHVCVYAYGCRGCVMRGPLGAGELDLQRSLLCMCVCGAAAAVGLLLACDSDLVVSGDA